MLRLLQKILIFSLIAGLLGNCFLGPLAYIDFELRKDYIAKVLCINKEKIEIGCNGQCFLMKRLNQANQKHNSGNKQLQERFQLTLFKQVTSEIAINAFTSLPAYEFVIIGTYKILSSHTIDIFHPPQLPHKT